MGPLHVAQINYAFDPGIADPEALLDRYSTLTGWSEAVAAAGASCVTVLQRFRRDAAIVRRGVNYLFRRDRTSAAPRHLHRTAARLAPDIAHVNGLVFPAQTWALSRTLGRRTAIVVQDHGGGAPGAPGDTGRVPLFRRWLWRRALGTADGFLFTSTEQADPWRHAGLVRSDQPIYPVIEASTGLRAIPRAAAKQASGVEGAPAVLWVGRLNANKDPLTVLEGFERSLAHIPAATLTMVYSTGDLLRDVQQRVESSSALRGRVRLAGAVPHKELAAFYGAADVFVAGSHHEGSGYALIEACACGAAPVVTNIPAFRAITGDGAVGALWIPDDAGSLAKALVETARRDPGNRREAVVAHFDRTLAWPVIGRRAMDAYRDVLAKRRSRVQAAG